MRKWTYLVAALLMSGATATFTSCIDTEEPAGITDLRGAKADFIRAKAAYQDAVTQLEYVKIEREQIYKQMEEIDLQMKQIDLELKQANADYLIEEWTQKKDYLIEQYKAWMAEAQAKTAWAQATLIRALADLEVAELTARDDAFAAEILQTRGALNTALSALTVAQGDLYVAEMSQLAYVSRNQNYVHSRELLIAEQQYDLTIFNNLLDSYKNITNPNDLAELNKKKAEIENKIAALDQKEYDAVMALEEKRNSGAFADASREMEGVLNELKKDTAFVLPVAQVDASIQAGLYSVLTTQYGSSIAAIDRIFNDDQSEMTADFELNAAMVGASEIQLQYLRGNVTSLANSVINEGKRDYVSDYNSLFTNGSITSAFENDNQVKSSLAAKVEAEKERLSVDAANINTNYKKILKEWVDSYVAYQKALKDYGYAGGPNATNTEYEKVGAAIQTFKELRDATTAPTDDQLKAGAKTLRSAIQAYAALRNPVDGAAESYLKALNDIYGVTTASGTAVDPLDTPANVTNFANNYIGSNSVSDIVGVSAILDVISLNDLTSYPEEGTSMLHKFMYAAYRLFGNADQFAYDYSISQMATSIDLIYEPVLADVTKAPADDAGYEAAIPTDLEMNADVQGAYRENLAAQDFDGQYPGLANYDKWLALYNYIDGQADLINDRVLALNDAKDAVIAKYDDAYMDLWEAELEAYLIKGNSTVTYSTTGTYTVVSTDNPYYDYLTTVSSDLTNGGVSYNELTELTALNRQLNVIDDAISNGEFYYVTYNETTDKYEVTDGQKALETLIEETQVKIAGIESQIAQYEDEIKWFEEYGWDGVMTSEYYENWVAEEEQIVANKQADVDYYTAALQKLLDAFAATGE